MTCTIRRRSHWAHSELQSNYVPSLCVVRVAPENDPFDGLSVLLPCRYSTFALAQIGHRRKRGGGIATAAK